MYETRNKNKFEKIMRSTSTFEKNLKDYRTVSNFCLQYLLKGS